MKTIPGLRSVAFIQRQVCTHSPATVERSLSLRVKDLGQWKSWSWISSGRGHLLLEERIFLPAGESENRQVWEPSGLERACIEQVSDLKSPL